MKKKIGVHKIGTKLMLTYSMIIFLVFVCMSAISLEVLRQQRKEELIRTDKESLRQITSSIVLMTDLMVEKVINIYSDKNIQEFFSDYADLNKEDFQELKSKEYEVATKLKNVQTVLQENALLYTQMNGGVILITREGATFTSWISEYFLDYSSDIIAEMENWNQYFDTVMTSYKWEIVNGRDAMSFKKNEKESMLQCIYEFSFYRDRARKGYICIAIDAEELGKCYSSWMDADMDNEIFLLASNEERLVGLNTQEEIKIPQEQLARIKGCFGGIEEESTFEDNQYIYNCIYISERDWVLVNRIPLDYIQKANRRQLLMFTVIFVAGTLCACGIVIGCTYRFSKRINYIKDRMKNAASEQYNVRYEMHYYDELDEIGESYNLMLDELKNYMSKLVEEEKAKKISDINYLHAQINTHFLYNIFNSIKVLSVLGRNEDINQLITSLVRLLKGTLDVSEEMLTIEEELQNVKHYFNIENIVHLEELELEIQCEDRLKGMLIPKLLLQPIIENSVLHGFSYGDEKKKKRIKITVEEERSGQLCITAQDNGCGISRENLTNVKKNRHNHTSGIGLKNVEERIHILFGEEYGIEVESELRKGTRVMVHIPMVDK